MKVTPTDAEKIALKNLFAAAGLDFDPDKEVKVLNEEYRIYVTAKAGVVIGQSTATEIRHEKIDVQQSMIDQADAARKEYKEKYGEEVPESHTNDLSFLSAMSDPNFDAKKYIEEDGKIEPPTDLIGAKVEATETPESMQKLYFETFGVNVAPPKKNNIGWMKQKIDEKLAQK